MSRKKESWLACKNGFAVCLICASRYGGGAGPNKFANGQGSLRRKDCITQHSTSAEHKEAQQAWEQRLRAEATQGLGETISVFTGPAPAASAKAASGKVAPATAAAGAVVRTPQSAMGYRAVVAARALLETSGSFHSLDVWLGALGSEERQAFASAWHCKRLVTTMAHYERMQTHRLLREGAVFRLEADGLERTYQVEIGTVLWSLPACLQHLPNHGQQEGLLQELGPRGPWVIERIIGMREFPQAMDCEGKVAMIEECVRRACQSARGEIDA